MGVYINEHLIHSAFNDKAQFFDYMLGGFTIDVPQPSYSICGCENSEEDTCKYRLAQASVLSNLCPDGNCNRIPFSSLTCDENIDILPALGLNEIYERIANNNMDTDTSYQIESQSNETDSFTYAQAILDANSTCVSLLENGDISACFDISCFVN